jgi:hypothetical protein
MALAISNTTPSLVARSQTVTNSNVTASFTPPLGALLLVMYTNPSNTSANQNKPTNTGGAVTWDGARILTQALTNGVICSFWGGVVITSASMTVTQGISANSADWAEGVIVITGKAASPYGQTQTATSASGTPSATISALTGSNSLVIGAIGNHTSASGGTAGSGQSKVFGTKTFNTTDATGSNASWGQWLTGGAAGTSATINDTAPTSIAYGLAMIEILASTGTPPQILMMVGVGS